MMKMDLEDCRTSYQLIFDLNREPTIHFHHYTDMFYGLFVCFFITREKIFLLINLPVQSKPWWRNHSLILASADTENSVSLLSSPDGLCMRLIHLTCHTGAVCFWLQFLHKRMKHGQLKSDLMWQKSVIIQNPSIKQLSTHVFTSCIL